MHETHATARILSGLPLRDELLAQVKQAVALLPKPPRLVIVQVGNDAASSAYIRQKLAACARVGIAGEHLHLPDTESEASFHSLLGGLAHDADVQALIVQTPLPAGWDVQAALDKVPAAKDIDGLSSANIALRRAGAAYALWPATPLGIMRMLEHMRVDVRGKPVAVIGRGMVVGAPLREILTAAGARVIGIDKATPTPAALCVAADIVICAAGVPGLVTADWVKPGAVVIDVGITRVDGKILGDVHRASVEDVAAVLTPVPGGVGPMTVASILTNVVDAFLLQSNMPKAAWPL